MSSLEELRIRYQFTLGNLMEKYNSDETINGSEESRNLLSEIERINALLVDVDEKIQKRDAMIRKEIVDEADKADKKMEAEAAAERLSIEKKADRKANIIVASITGGCGLLGGLIKINRQNNLVESILEFSKDSEVTGCSKQSLFRSLLGDFFKI